MQKAFLRSSKSNGLAFWLLCILCFFATGSSFAQSMANYAGANFAATSGTYTPLSGGTTVPVLIDDDAASAFLPLGFTFYYMGRAYTQVRAGSDGYLSFGASGSSITNNLATGTTVERPVIAPFWDDMDGRGTGAAASYLTTGSAGSRVFTFEWLNWVRTGGTTPVMSFQVKLYEGTGVIQFIYRSEATALSGAGASIGLSAIATGSGNFVSLNNATATPTTSTTSETTTISTKPATGQIYTFTPPQAAVAAPTTLSFTALTLSGMTLNWVDNATNETQFNVFRSTDGINFTYVATVNSTTTGATGGAYNYVATGLNASTTYQWQVVANSEGVPSTPLSGSQSTNACSISGTRTIGASGANYTSIASAIADLTANGVSGPVVLELQVNYAPEGAVTLPLIPCASAANTITIRPTAAVASAFTLTSSAAAPTLDITGGQYYIIDGRNGGTGTNKFITIANTSTSGQALRFVNEASNNVIQYCTLQGVNNSTTSGVVLFSTTTGANGNDNNTISTCDIRDGATTPANCIYASGTTTTTAHNNSGNTISGCNISNFFLASGADNGILISSGNTDWNITGNSFFQTASRTYTSGAVHAGINIANSSGNNFIITGNYIGGGAASAGGSAWTVAGTIANRFRGMSLSVGSTTATSVQGNTIANISMASSSGAATIPGVFSGIYLLGGNANIGNTSGNTIGSATGTGSITVTISTTGGISYGIACDASSTVSNISNNIIGSVTTAGTGTLSHSFTGIATSAGTTLTINNNTIGGTTANSINVSPAATGTTAAVVTGINNSSSATISISNNTITNLNNGYLPASANTSSVVRGIISSSGVNTITGNNITGLTTAANATGTSSSASVIGISMTSTTAGQSVSRNTIGSLANNNAGANAVGVTGIYYSGPSTGTNLIARNLVHSLTSGGTNASAFTYGIHATGGATTVQNNMIRMGAGLNLGIDIRGINEIATTNNYYFNSIYVGGAPTTNAMNSFAFISTVTINTRNIQNNIFWNARSNAGSTGKHYAISVGGTTVNPTGLTSNYNDLFVSGTGGFVGLYNNVDRLDLAAWQAATGQDASSLSSNPMFVSVSDLHLASGSPAESAGTPIAAVTDDFDGDIRAGLTPVDIGADAGNFGALCTGSPTAGTISSVPTSICNSGSAVLTLTGASIGNGISYQWKESTVSGGPYTNVGTGLATYTTATISATRYYVVDVTCSNGPTTVSTAQYTLAVNPVPTVGVTPSSDTICNPGGAAVTLTASGASTYAWSPATGLSATTGAVVNANPTVTTTYTVTGTDGNGCVNTATATVTVGTTPPNATASSSVPAVCPGTPFNLFASADASGTATIFTQNFNSGLGGWSVQNGTGHTAGSEWIIQTPPYTYLTTITNWTGFNNTPFIVANSDVTGSTSNLTVTRLVSPVFSTTGYTNATLTFNTFLRSLSETAVGVEYSVNGGANWTSITTTPAIVIGTSVPSGASGNPPSTASVTATLPAGAIGQASVLLRFRYDASWDYYWGIDDIVLSGTPVPTYAWTSTPPGFTSAVQNPTGVTASVNTTYNVVITGSGGCTTQVAVPVTVHATPTATVSGGGTVCSSDPLPSVTFTFTGTSPWNLTYSNGVTNIPVNNIVTDSYVIPNAPAGTYTVVSVSDANCSGTGSGSVIVAVSAATTWYQDSDTDTYGNPSVTQMACSQPVGYVANNTDCDDTNAAINPATVWYLDVDNDNYYTGAGITQCTSPGPGYKFSGLLGGNDCNDGNAAINPGATEVCNGVDDNCVGGIDEGVQTTYYLDADADGYYTGSPVTACTSPGVGYVTSVLGGNDCDDNESAAYPGATEVCDGIDNNCDLGIDEGVQLTFYEDVDQDGYGDPNSFTMDCTPPLGYVANDDDCDDFNSALNPTTVWYLDADNDNYYVTGSEVTQCTSPGIGYKYTGLLGGNDCNDGNAAINPGATEIINSIDDNCNGSTDETGVTYYRDMDIDTYGDPNNSVFAASPPPGYVLNNTDCNDSNAAINPGATEICNGIDDDCDVAIDEGVQTTYYRDMDGDGFGNPAVTQLGCTAPSGYVANSTDCNDSNALEKPGQVWYKDTDNDNYAETGAATVTQCTRPTGYKAASELTAITGDCNDNNAAIKPGATEVCDGVDNNCNGSADEGVQTTYYRDMDGDGFGNPAVTQLACSPPSGYVTNNTDCNDNSALEKPGQVWYKDTDNDNYAETGAATVTQCLRPTGYKAASELTAITGDCNDNAAGVNPAATEICDGIDNNCNGSTDEGVQTTYYRDMDGDGFGNPAITQLGCSPPSGYVVNSTDCNDNNSLEKPGQVWYKDTDNDNYAETGAATITQCTRPTGYKAASELTATTGDCNDGNASIHPNAAETCNGIDDDCDVTVDEGVQTVYYRDMDGDGFGNPAVTQSACSPSAGYVSNNTDCNDNSALEKPGQVWYKDTDNDNYAETGAATVTQCTRPTGYKAASELTAITGDCNDANAAINPVATETCDGIDNNCNGSTDEGVQTTYYRDMDGDGFGNPAVTQSACSQPSGYVANNTDCNDNSALEKPGQVWYKDTDNDGYAQTGAATITQCLRPVGYKAASELTATTGDCNDNNAAIKPGATEVCNGIDDDCDGSTDEGLVYVNYYRDMDNDGYGNPAVIQTSCTGSAPAGFVSNNTDCNDSNNTIYPGAPELCDGLDNNCNGQTDENRPISSPWANGDVGAPGVNGSASNGCGAGGSGTFNVSASGFSTSSSDKLHMVYRTVCGNTEITARVLNVSDGGWAGITLRESLAAGSKKVALKTQLSSIVRREIRSATNGASNILNFSRPTHVWLRLTRSGSNFVGYTSMDGINWDFAFSATVPMNGCLYAGLFAESINTNVQVDASFDNVTVTGGTPPPALVDTQNAPAAADDLQLSVFPNPTSGNLTLSVVSGTPERNLQLEVIDALGRVIRKAELPESAMFTYPLDLSSEPAGIYYLRLRSELGMEKMERIVVQQ